MKCDAREAVGSEVFGSADHSGILVIVDVVGLTARGFLNTNPNEAPVEQMGHANDRRKFLVAALRMISGVICAAPATLAGYAWCSHFYMHYTGGYATNSFSWYMLAIDLTWITAACLSFVAIGWLTWRLAAHVARNSFNVKT